MSSTIHNQNDKSFLMSSTKTQKKGVYSRPLSFRLRWQSTPPATTISISSTNSTAQPPSPKLPTPYPAHLRRRFLSFQLKSLPLNPLTVRYRYQPAIALAAPSLGTTSFGSPNRRASPTTRPISKATSTRSKSAIADR